MPQETSCQLVAKKMIFIISFNKANWDQTRKLEMINKTKIKEKISQIPYENNVGGQELEGTPQVICNS
jgi:hypothetical protein